MVANVDFRRALSTNLMSSRNENRDPPSEATPLLANGSGQGSSHREPPQGWKHFFFNSRETPGTDHHNRMVRYSVSTWHVTKVTLLNNYVNFLLVIVPLAIIAGESKWSPTTVFVLNFFAIIPLAAVLSFATEEIAMRLGQAMGGLLNATFGNAVELIVSIVALYESQIEVVQASMLGSILSNLLLVLGMCFLLGGWVNRKDADGNSKEQVISSGIAQTTGPLLALSSASLVIPAALYNVLDGQRGRIKSDPGDPVLLLSRGTAIILLVTYASYLFFQLITHHEQFQTDKETNTETGTKKDACCPCADAGCPCAQRLRASATSGVDEETVGEGSNERNNDDRDVEAQHSEPQPKAEIEAEEPCIGPIPAALVLVVTTIVIGVCADYLVGSIDDVVETAGISKTFIGLILIPIVGNAAEHVTAVVVAVKDKMDLAMGVAIGSSIQIATLVTPFLVIFGWIIHEPMSLHFETFSTVAFAFSVIVVTYAIQDGKSNYLEGVMLLGLYCIIALAFYVSPSLEEPGV